MAEIGGAGSAAHAAEIIENQRRHRRDLSACGHSTSSGRDKIGALDDIKRTGSTSQSSGDDKNHELEKTLATTKTYATQRVAVVHGIDRPLFHIDLTSALQSAVENVKRKEEEDEKAHAVEEQGV